MFCLVCTCFNIFLRVRCVSGGRGVSGGGGVFWLLMDIFGVSVVDLLADLLGKGQLNILAVWGAKGRHTFLKGLRHNLGLWDCDALLLREILARDPGEGDWLVHAGLDWLRVDDVNNGLNNGNNGNVVTGLLSNLLTVVVSVGVAISVALRLGRGN